MIIIRDSILQQPVLPLILSATPAKLQKCITIMLSIFNSYPFLGNSNFIADDKVLTYVRVLSILE